MRVTAGAVGVSGILLGLLIDLTPWGRRGSFGTGQLLLVVTGLAIILVAILGKRSAKLYRDFAVVLLNSLITLALLELGAIVLTRTGLIGRLGTTVSIREMSDLPYYASRDWSATYWREAELSEAYEYTPFNEWIHREFHGEMVNTDAEGRRVTPGADCGPGSFKVFTFGGSSMWGWGSPDWGTIPAYLQSELRQNPHRGRFCVRNYGEDGYVSTQEVVVLMKALQRGQIPDAVIFYDGVNDVTAAYQTGQPGAHVSMRAMKLRLEAHPLSVWVRRSRAYWLLSKLVAGDRAAGAHVDQGGKELRDLSDGIASVYLANYRFVSGLAAAYGFQFYFFLQPHLAVETKPLTVEEQRMSERMSEGMAELARGTYERIGSATDSLEQMWSITDVFAGIDSQTWIDRWGHVTPEGNRIVAARIFGLIGDRLE